MNDIHLLIVIIKWDFFSETQQVLAISSYMDISNKSLCIN